MTNTKRRTKSETSELIYDAHNFGIVIDTREIFIAPNLNQSIDDAMVDHVVAHQFIRNLQILNSLNDDPILVHMMTCGGAWDYGMAIYDAIKASYSYITILSYAHSRSMSSIIPQAADLRISMPNADFMIHWGYDAFAGNHTSVISEAEWAKKDASKMLDIYTEKCLDGQYFKDKNMDEKAVRRWLKNNMDKKQEFYMTARDAVDRGLLDGILGDEKFESIKSLKNNE
jgi:ATP-dependent protease ClpP protease subunit